MKRSDSIATLGKALNDLRAEVGTIITDKVNEYFQHHKYASLTHILDKTEAIMSKLGLCVIQIPDGNSLHTTITHLKSGEYIEAAFDVHAADMKPHLMGSAITYARRYALVCVLGLKIEGEDDDGNRAQYPDGNPRQARNNQNNQAPAGSTQGEGQSANTNGTKKPWLEEKPFGDALKRITGGELNVIDKLKEFYQINGKYLRVLEAAELVRSSSQK